MFEGPSVGPLKAIAWFLPAEKSREGSLSRAWSRSRALGLPEAT